MSALHRKWQGCKKSKWPKQSNHCLQWGTCGGFKLPGHGRHYMVNLDSHLFSGPLFQNYSLENSQLEVEKWVMKNAFGASHEVVCTSGCTLESGCPSHQFCTSMDTTTTGRCLENSDPCPSSPFGSGLELAPKGKGVLGSLVNVSCPIGKSLYKTSPTDSQTLVCSTQGWVQQTYGKPTTNPFHCKPEKAPHTCSSIPPKLYNGEVRVTYNGLHVFNCLPGYRHHPLVSTNNAGSSVNVSCSHGMWHQRDSYGRLIYLISRADCWQEIVFGSTFQEQ